MESIAWVKPLKTWKTTDLNDLSRFKEEPPFNNWGTKFWSISFHISISIESIYIYIYHGGYTYGEWIGYVSSLWSCMIARGEPYFHIFLAFQDSCRKTEIIHDQLIVPPVIWHSYDITGPFTSMILLLTMVMFYSKLLHYREVTLTKRQRLRWRFFGDW